MESKKISQKELSSLWNVTPQYVSGVLSGKGFGIEAVKRTAETFKDINLNWLLTGEGDMLIHSNEYTLQEPNELYKKKFNDKRIEELELRVKELQAQNQKLLDIISNVTKPKD